MVDVYVFEPVEVEELETEEVWSVVEGIREGCVVEKVPYRFIRVGKTFNVEYKTVSVPMGYPVRVKEKIGELAALIRPYVGGESNRNPFDSAVRQLVIRVDEQYQTALNFLEEVR